MSFYTPALRLRRFTELTPQQLQKMGIKGIITDLDDTLAARNCDLPDEEVTAWIKNLIDAGVRICIVSNNHKKRTEKFAIPLGIPFFYEAKKPLKRTVFRAVKAMDLKTDEIALLGDQLFTDMAVANRCGMKGILVDPVGTYGGWFVQLKRKIEIPLRKNIHYNKIF